VVEGLKSWVQSPHLKFLFFMISWIVPSSLDSVINIIQILLQGAHPLYRPAPANLVPASDPLCQRVQHDNPNQCDYDISFADGSSSMGVHVRDNMQFISEDGERENADIVFGYVCMSQPSNS
jgi:hypothetical protein